MFWAPERPVTSIERWKVGRWNTPSDVPTFQPSASVSSKRVHFHRRAHAHQVAVAVGAVHASHGRPNFVLARPRRGKGRALACVRPFPAAGDHVREGARGGGGRG